MRWVSWALFAVMCLLAGAELVLAGIARRGLPPLIGAALRMALASILFRATAPRFWNLRVELELGGWAALLWVPLPVLFAAAGGSVPGITELLVLALIPVGAVFAQAQDDTASGEDTGGLVGLLPALIGFGGAALLLPYRLPGSTAGRAWLAAMGVAALLSGWALFRVQAAARSVALRPALAAASSGAALGTLCFAWVGFEPLVLTPEVLIIEAGRFVLLDVPLFVLAIFLLRRLPLAAYATRYLLVPLLVAAAGLLLDRPPIGWTIYTGAGLILAGCWALLREALLLEPRQEPR